jgi:hypothetical protein
MDTMLQMTVEHLLNEGNLDPAELVMILRGIADEIEADIESGCYEEQSAEIG